MTASPRRACVVLLLAALAVGGCERESREFARPAPGMQVGDTEKAAEMIAHYERNAYALSEGKKLWSWYNCSGCHANGGGGIGPPLIKPAFLYGSEPANLFDTIIKGGRVVDGSGLH